MAIRETTSQGSGAFWCPFHEAERPAKRLWSVDGYELVRCLDCGLVHLANPPSGEEAERLYSEEYFEGEMSRKGYASYSADEQILRLNFRKLLGKTLRELRGLGRDPSDLALLDHGCAYGYFLDGARPVFGAVVGTEINERVAAIGRERFGLEIHSGESAIHGLGEASVDVITMWDVIEHLRAPRAALRACRRALRPGGILCLTTGDIDSVLARLLGRRWRLINPPQHISYFSIRTLRNLLGDVGFEVLRTERCGKHVSLHFLSFIASYLLRRERPVRLPTWLTGRSLYLNLRDVMFVCAQRAAGD
jgi:SAM-dependent methyltransferase